MGRMALKHVVLAVVAGEPGHGYAIHARVIEALPIARPCDSARVYAILGDLERAGWVGSTLEEDGRGRHRRCHHATSAGLRALHRWIASPRAGRSLLRRALLVQLAWPAHDPDVWTRALERKRIRRRAIGLLEDPGPGLARLVRLREKFHLDAEIASLQALDEADRLPAGGRLRRRRENGPP